MKLSLVNYIVDDWAPWHQLTWNFVSLISSIVGLVFGGLDYQVTGNPIGLVANVVGLSIANVCYYYFFPDAPL